MTESYLLLTYSRNFSCKGKAYTTSTQNDDPSVLLWQPWEKWACCKDISEAKFVFPSITEISKLVGLHKLGQCILSPIGYFYAEMK